MYCPNIATCFNSTDFNTGAPFNGPGWSNEVDEECGIYGCELHIGPFDCDASTSTQIGYAVIQAENVTFHITDPGYTGVAFYLYAGEGVGSDAATCTYSRSSVQTYAGFPTGYPLKWNGTTTDYHYFDGSTPIAQMWIDRDREVFPLGEDGRVYVSGAAVVCEVP